MKKKILFMASLVGAMMLTACSSEDNSAEQGGQVDVAKGITFQFSEEAFVPGVIGDKETQGTRVGMQPQSVDLGNGLVAEMSIEPDTAGTPQTRAPQPMSDGHYKIYAVDANNVRHNGLSGTITAGVFTPDVAGQRWKLKSGETYTFVCINDAVTDNGTSLTVSYTAQNAMIGVTQHTVSATTDKDVVAFEMKHQQPRVRYQITSYTTPCVGAKINFASDSGPDWGTEDFNLKGQSTGLGNNGFLNGNDIPMTSTATVEYSPYVKAHKVSTLYQYYAEGSNLRYIQYFSFKGTLHGKNLATETTAGSTLRNKINSMTNTAATIHKNRSYVVNIKLKSKDPLLLFQDGTVGYYGDRTTARQPVGLVIDPKTASSDGLAVSLKGGNACIYTNDITTQTNPLMSTDFNTLHADMDGYRYTYEASGNVDGSGKSKAEVAVNGGKYDAYYQTVHFNAGAPISFSGGKTGKWFLPSMGQWKHMLDKLFAPNTLPIGFSDYGFWYTSTAETEDYITNIGADYLMSSWLSAEYNVKQAVYYMTYDGPAGNEQTYLYEHTDKTNKYAKVRPFIYF